MNGIVETAWLLSDGRVAQTAYELLLPYAALPMVGGPCVTCFGSVHQALGVASLTTGNLDLAIDHLTAAIQHNLAIGHWPAVASARERLGQAYRQRRGPGDQRAAQAEAAAAQAEAAARGGGAARGSSPAEPQVASCEREGRSWRITVGDRSVLVHDSIGMLHLAVLIANPRQDILAADLVAGLASLDSSAAAPREVSSAQPVLDPQAVREYRDRLRRLDAELGGLAADDTDRADRLEAERDWLLAQLASAAGLSGRARNFADDGERARVAVRKAIRRALVRIGDADELIGEHLSQRVRTGTRCSYWPG
jgi:hypothetical protein